MFRDAYYIHIIRDERAVVNSLLNVPWWADNHLWWLGIKPASWKEKHRDPVELCALTWKKNVQEVFDNKHLFAERYIEVRYEELVEDVHGTVLKITDFCKLNRSSVFENLLPRSLSNKNYKWKTGLSKYQKKLINSSVGAFLSELDYK